MNGGNTDINANTRIKTGFFDSMPPRHTKVESNMASSINFLEEKLSESVTKYGVLYDKHFADKLKKIVA